jgi:23S rRNA-/tRNA-specific pseudouridylate synthase
LLVAKTPTMARQLTQAFTDRKVTKYYTGLSFKTPKKKKQGWVQGYMRRGRRKSWYLTRDAESKKEDDTDAVWAQSFFWTAGLGNVADAFYPPSNADHVAVTPSPRTLLLLRPHTGRTHQLRVAAKSVGLPLAGDPLYTTATTTTASAATSPTVPRTCLHATGLHIAAACFDNDVGLTEDLILWSPPPFLAWWRDPHYLAAKSLLRLLQKDTTVPPGLRQAAVDALGPEDKES